MKLSICIFLGLVFLGCGGSGEGGGQVKSTELDMLDSNGNYVDSFDKSWVAIDIRDVDFIVDKKTTSNDVKYSLTGAAKYCRDLDIANLQKWGIATSTQMQVIKAHLIKNPHYFGKTDVDGFYWSAESNGTHYINFNFEIIGASTSTERRQAGLDLAASKAFGGNSSLFNLFCVHTNQ